MSWGNIAVAGAALVGSVVSSSSANKAADKAAGAQQGASDAQIALAREQRDLATRLLQPEVNRGGRAQSYLDALQYGQGSYAEQSVNDATGGRGAVGTPDYAYFTERNPDLVQYYQKNKAGVDRAYGSFDNYIAAMFDDHASRPGFSDTRMVGEGAGGAGAGGGAGSSVTRADVEAQINASVPSRLTEQEYQAQEGITAGSYSDLNAIEQSGYDRDRASYADTRTGVRGVADENYANTVELLDEDLLRRQGYTDQEIAAWTALAEQERDRAISAAASRMGVTGGTGRATRTIGDVTQTYAMEKALYEGGRRRADYEPYSEGRLAADAARGGSYADAEQAYWNAINDRNALNTTTRLGITERRDNQRSTNQSNRTTGQQASYADYVAGLRADADRGFQARSGQASAGASYADTAGSAIGRSADASSAAAIAKGQNQQALYGGIADIAGNAWASIQNNRKKTAPTSYADYNSDPTYQVRTPRSYSYT